MMHPVWPAATNTDNRTGPAPRDAVQFHSHASEPRREKTQSLRAHPTSSRLRALRRTRLLALWAALLITPHAHALPDGFVYLAEVAPRVLIDARYADPDNFVGQPVDGYHANTVVLTRPAAEAVARVSEELAAFGLGLKVFDGYRPQHAVTISCAGPPTSMTSTPSRATIPTWTRLTYFATATSPNAPATAVAAR